MNATYTCPFCGSAFNRSCDIAVHARHCPARGAGHHRRAPIMPCPTCGRADFKDSCVRERHVIDCQDSPDNCECPRCLDGHIDEARILERCELHELHVRGLAWWTCPHCRRVLKTIHIPPVQPPRQQESETTCTTRP